MSADRITDEQADVFLAMVGDDLFAQEPVRDTLSAYIRQLREDVAWRESVLTEVRATLEALDGPSPHTPPMMYPEWIKCVAAHQRKAVLDALIERAENTEKNSFADHAWLWLKSIRHEEAKG